MSGTSPAPAGATGAGGTGGTNGTFGMNAAPADGDASGHGDLSEDAGMAAERERLARQLRDTRMQLAMTQTRLAALEQSASMRFGRTIANAAKKPWPRAAVLPRDLYRLWRDRGAPKSGAANAAKALADAQLADLAGSGGRFLSALTAPGVLNVGDPALTLAGAGIGAEAGGAGSASLVIAGAISALGCATLAPDAVVHPLLPHDADVMIEGTGADLVLIEAAALLPGEPWAHATDPAATDRGRRLARLIVMARALGKPVILARNVPASLMPGLGWLAASCDAVVDGGLGVQLARFNPIGVSAARPVEPAYAGERDPREAPRVRALLDSLTSGASPAVRLVTPPAARGWRALPALYRSLAVLVAAGPRQGWEQTASGARVIGPLGSGVTAQTARGQLDAARAAPPLAPVEIRTLLRDVFAEHATPVALAGLARAAGLPGAVVGGRRIAVLCATADAAQARRLAAAVLGQRLRPAEVIVAAADPDAVREALSGLADQGIRVVVTPPAGNAAPGGADAEWARPLARLANAPWLAPWVADAGQPANYLLDLACARECAQADAVGFGAVEYEFTRWLDEPALARSALLAPGGPPADDWGAHGLRLFTITH